MYAHKYFTARYFPDSYFPPTSGAPEGLLLARSSALALVDAVSFSLTKGLVEATVLVSSPSWLTSLAVSDALLAVDTRVSDLAVTHADLIPLSDEAVRELGFALVDSLTPTDEKSAGWLVAREDYLVTGVLLSREVDYARSEQDAVTALDTNAFVLATEAAEVLSLVAGTSWDLEAARADALALSDGSVRDTDKGLEDLLPASDAFQRQADFNVSLTSSVVGVDLLSRESTLACQDSLAGADLSARELGRDVQDILGSQDSFARSAEYERLLSDAFLLTQLRTATFEAVFSDEVLSSSEHGLGTVQGFGDDLSVAAQLVSRDMGKQLVDTLLPTDLSAKQLERPVQDSLALTSTHAVSFGMVVLDSQVLEVGQSHTRLVDPAAGPAASFWTTKRASRWADLALAAKPRPLPVEAVLTTDPGVHSLLSSPRYSAILEEEEEEEQ